MAGGPWRSAGGRRTPACLFGIALFVLPGCFGSDGPTVPPALPIEEVEFAPELGIDLSTMEERPSGLWLLQEEEGTGPAAETESILVLDYEGWLPDGTLFDTSLDGDPFSLILAQQSVISGFEEGVLGMRAGGQRLLLIPPHLGYGPRQIGTIPPNSWLVFRTYMRSVSTP